MKLFNSNILGTERQPGRVACVVSAPAGFSAQSLKVFFEFWPGAPAKVGQSEPNFQLIKINIAFLVFVVPTRFNTYEIASYGGRKSCV